MPENEIENKTEVKSAPESAPEAAEGGASQEPTPPSSPASLTFSDELVGSFGEALEADTDEAYRHWGLALYHSIDDAKAHAKSAALGLKPRDALDHYNLGCAHATAGKFKDASRAFEKSLEHDPSLYEAKHNLALAKEQSGEAEAARKLWTEALELADEEESVAIRQHITEISG